MVDRLKDVHGIVTSTVDTATADTRKGITSLTEETGEALEGRFTALQMAGEEIKLQNIEQTYWLSSIDLRLSELVESQEIGIIQHLNIIHSLVAESILELKGINDNTRVSSKTLKSIDTTLSGLNTFVRNNM